MTIVKKFFQQDLVNKIILVPLRSLKIGENNINYSILTR